MENIVAAIKKLLDDPSITDKRIHLNTGVATNSLSRYRRGLGKVENMPLVTAFKLYEYYNRIKGEMIMDNKQRSILFGRAWAVLEVIARRMYEKESHAIKWRDKLPDKPATTINKMHQMVHGHVHKFGKIEHDLLQRFDEIISGLEDGDFDDAPLDSVYLVAMSKERNPLWKYVLWSK